MKDNILQIPGAKMPSAGNPPHLPRPPKSMEINVSPAAQKYLADMRKLVSDMGKYAVIPAMTIRKLYFRVALVSAATFFIGLFLGWLFFK
jgi:hypothetical protein